MSKHAIFNKYLLNSVIEQVLLENREEVVMMPAAILPSHIRYTAIVGNISARRYFC